MSDMEKFPFFFTWAEQNKAVKIDIEEVGDTFFTMPKGKKVYDLSSISFQASFGLSNPRIKEAIKDQLDLFSIVSPKAVFPLKKRASQKLLELIEKKKNPSGRIFYTLSGAESVENALKMTREIKKKQIILCRQRSYHGATLGALSITGDWRNKPHRTIDEWTVRIPEPHEDPTLEKTEAIIEKVGPENIAGFCLETMTGGNGVIIPSKEWWEGIQRLSDKYNIFLILDEVICGFQRTGKAFGLHHYPFLKPHFICLAKGITGGHIPFGAVWTSREIAEFYDHNVLSCGLTSYAHPLGLAAMEVIIDLLNDPSFVDHTHRLEQILNGFLEKWDNLPCVQNIRSKGLLAAIEIDRQVDFKFLLEKGLHLVIQPKTLILSPGLVYKEETLKVALEKLDDILKTF
ncbi:MAG: aminotransferase class III-fold pyridoxal phosphate-dependent enzyme [Bdellovibrionota bacterium]|nr:aminotransferase class III-fold pyridoxal phosphate-dependent enzyme [Bdellovibrionota bacterium]